MVKMSRVGDLLCTHPVVSILSASVRDRLLSNATETVKAYGPLLYREGSGPTGVWFVSLAIEKVSFCLRSLHYILVVVYILLL